MLLDVNQKEVLNSYFFKIKETEKIPCRYVANHQGEMQNKKNKEQKNKQQQ